MPTVYRAIVFGPALTQGSKFAFKRKDGSLGTRESAANFYGRRQEMIKSMSDDTPNKPIDNACFCFLRIYVNRPESHFDKDGNLKANAPKYPKSGSDLDKIQRAVGDCAKIAKWVKNDARIAKWDSMRVYNNEVSEIERVEVMLYDMEEGGEYFLYKILNEIYVTAGYPIQDKFLPADAPFFK